MNRNLVTVTYDGQECYFLSNCKKYMEKHIHAVGQILDVPLILIDGATYADGTPIPEDFQILIPVEVADKTKDIFGSFIAISMELGNQYRERLIKKGYPFNEVFHVTNVPCFFGYDEIFKAEDYQGRAAW